MYEGDTSEALIEAIKSTDHQGQMEWNDNIKHQWDLVFESTFRNLGPKWF